MLTEAASTEILTDPRVGPGWLRLLRAARAAFDISKVVLAALGLILLQTGWGSGPSVSGIVGRGDRLHALPGGARSGRASEPGSVLMGVRPLGRLAADRTGTDTCDSLDLAICTE